MAGLSPPGGQVGPTLGVLVMNGGSSTLKSSLYALPEAELRDVALEPLWTAHADWSHDPGTAEVRIGTAHGASLDTRVRIARPIECLDALLPCLWSGPTRVIEGPERLGVVGHRVVHGGSLRESTRATPEVREILAGLVDLAPAHNPLELAILEATDRLLAGVIPQVVVFDTAFHATLPRHAYVYPLPYEWLQWGVRRYGFHGISHQYVSRRAAALLGRPLDSLRLITCHLGNGCSMAAIAGGLCLDTTMGFTPLEGLMMGSRSGSVDPGVLTYLLRRRGFTPDGLDAVLNEGSGLKGVSGLSSDMRTVLEAMDQGHDRARLAFEIYVHRIRCGIGAMLSSLGGLDALVFTAGVGENAAPVRAAACRALECFGLALSPERNAAAAGDEDVAAPGSRARILVVRTREDWEIARECHRLVGQGAGTPPRAG